MTAASGIAFEFTRNDGDGCEDSGTDFGNPSSERFPCSCQRSRPANCNMRYLTVWMILFLSGGSRDPSPVREASN